MADVVWYVPCFAVYSFSDAALLHQYITKRTKTHKQHKTTEQDSGSDDSDEIDWAGKDDFDEMMVCACLVWGVCACLRSDVLYVAPALLSVW